jgi:hypothetical protein
VHITDHGTKSSLKLNQNFHFTCALRICWILLISPSNSSCIPGFHKINHYCRRLQRQQITSVGPCLLRICSYKVIRNKNFPRMYKETVRKPSCTYVEKGHIYVANASKNNTHIYSGKDIKVFTFIYMHRASQFWNVCLHSKKALSIIYLLISKWIKNKV